MEAVDTRRVDDVEAHEAAPFLHALSGLVVQQEEAGHARAFRLEDATDPPQVLPDLVWQHMGKDRREKDEVERTVGKGKLVSTRKLGTRRIVGAARNDRAVKMERRVRSEERRG